MGDWRFHVWMFLTLPARLWMIFCAWLVGSEFEETVEEDDED
jgi:hypothetical protein